MLGEGDPFSEPAFVRPAHVGGRGFGSESQRRRLRSVNVCSNVKAPARPTSEQISDWWRRHRRRRNHSDPQCPIDSSGRVSRVPALSSSSSPSEFKWLLLANDLKIKSTPNLLNHHNGSLRERIKSKLILITLATLATLLIACVVVVYSQVDLSQHHHHHHHHLNHLKELQTKVRPRFIKLPATALISSKIIKESELERDNEEQLEPSSRRSRPAKRRRSALNEENNSKHFWLGTNAGRNQRQAAPRQDLAAPYKTFFVTQACEWKSSLFVPKSNDIHFAQHQHQVAPSNTNWMRQSSHQLDLHNANSFEEDSRTILSTTQKALVLALPLDLSRSNFNGFEPACSIRLIVPANMRILAKLSARKLSFEQQQVDQLSMAPRFRLGVARPIASQLWLNVSQSKFSEVEHQVIESESNVLAFRFLLERFAIEREPDVRFQAIVTAFQTLAENSDNFNQAPINQQQFICDSQRLISADLACDGFKNCQDGHDEEPTVCAALRQSNSLAPLPGNNINNNNNINTESRNQTLDSTSGGLVEQPTIFRRLWNLVARDSSSPLLLGLLLFLLLLLAASTCCLCWPLLLLRNLLRLRNTNTNTNNTNTSTNLRPGQGSQVGAFAEARRNRDRLIERRNWRQDQDKTQKGFFSRFKLFGLNQDSATLSKSGAGEELERHSLAQSQNVENAARLRAAQTDFQNQQQRRIQSILKRPGGGQEALSSSAGGAPLARFESIPPAPPPRFSTAAGGQRAERAVDVPSATSRSPIPAEAAAKVRGALASSLTSARQSGRATHGQFKPTPAVRATPFNHQQQLQPGPIDSRLKQTTTSSSRLAKPESVAPNQRQAADAERPSPGLNFESSSSRVEQTSSRSSGGEQTTVYQFSSSVARYSESYLLSRDRPAPSDEKR